MSRNIRLPPRVQLIEIDQQSGSYPTISRTGDPDRTGKFSIFFDDSKTVIFKNNAQVNLPSGLENSLITSQLLSVTSSLVATGSIKKGIADEFAQKNTPSQMAKPFNDVRVNNVMRDDPFYATGSSLEKVGFGFSERLISKTIISIDLTPSLTTSASIQNGATSDATNPITDYSTGAPDGGQAYVDRQFLGTANYPMMYYNFNLRKWEGVGRGKPTNITGSQGSFTPLASGMSELSVRFNLDEQMYGFAPSYGLDASAFGKAAAEPLAAYGFPIHPKFHATSSQLMHMSGVIDQPFLLEKIVYEFSGSYKTGSMEASSDRFSSTSRMLTGNGANGDFGAPISTFFILNQRGPTSFSAVISPTSASDGRSPPSSIDTLSPHLGVDPTTGQPWRHTLTASIPAQIQLSSGGQMTNVDTIRDLVTFAQVAAMGSSYTDSRLEALSRDLNIKNLDGSGIEYWSGKYVLSASVKSPVSNPVVMPMYMGINDTSTLKFLATPGFGNFGGRAVIEKSGRDFIAASVGNEPSASVTVTDGSTFTVTFRPGSVHSFDNPYILLPTDKLIFGWQVPMGAKAFAEGYGPGSLGWSSALSIAPGAGKLLLYGSLIRQNVGYQQTLNQPLTTVQVHEIIGNDIFDEFKTEPKLLYSGAYNDMYITGAMSIGSDSRKKLSSTLYTGALTNLFGKTLSNGQEQRARVPGLLRGSVHVSENERYYDTLMPRIDKIVQLNGSAVYKHGTSLTTYNHVILGLDKVYANLVADTAVFVNSAGSVYTYIVADASWDRSFPFEAKYASVERNVDVVGNAEATRIIGGGYLGQPLDKVYRAKMTVARALNHGESVNPTFPLNYLLEGDETNGAFPQSKRDILLHLYGIGHLESGTLSGVPHYASRSLANPFADDYTFGTIFRGFKYGILNALPEFTKTIFKVDSYGQFRDMLEQRCDSKYYDTMGLLADGTYSGIPGVTSSPVQIKFVEPRSNLITQPGKTFSSNLSLEATSSVPYIDGDVRNRNDPLNLSELNSVIVTF